MNRPPMELNVAFRTHDAATPAGTHPLQEALARAMEAARDPLGVHPIEPWRFYHLEPESVATVAWLNARLLEPEVGIEGARAAYEQWRAIPGWIVVTCPTVDDEAQMEAYREATLTAVQRASLSLWSDHIPTNWVTDLVTQDASLYQHLAIDRERETVLGILWYGHPERG